MSSPVYLELQQMEMGLEQGPHLGAMDSSSSVSQSVVLEPASEQPGTWARA